MKVLVCGSRDFRDYEMLECVLDEVDERNDDGISIIIGIAPVRVTEWSAPSQHQLGADCMAAYWAWEHDSHCVIVPAEWRTHGKAAGPIRNRQMLDMQPDLVVAFANAVDAEGLPVSRGTRDTVTEAKRRGIPVEIHTPAEKGTP